MQSTCYSCQIIIELESLTDYQKIFNIPNFIKLHPVGGGVPFHVDRQTWTNRRDRANTNFAQFCDTCLKIGSYYSDDKSAK